MTLSPLWHQLLSVPLGAPLLQPRGGFLPRPLGHLTINCLASRPPCHQCDHCPGKTPVVSVSCGFCWPSWALCFICISVLGGSPLVSVSTCTAPSPTDPRPGIGSAHAPPSGPSVPLELLFLITASRRAAQICSLVLSPLLGHRPLSSITEGAWSSLFLPLPTHPSLRLTHRFIHNLPALGPGLSEPSSDSLLSEPPGKPNRYTH